MTLEIVYFGMAGRGEVLKLIAEAGQVEYVFSPITFQDWPTLKPNTRYGQIPMLKINEEVSLYQTIPIARYLAQEGGLYPSDRIEASLSEEYVAAVDEIIAGFVTVFFKTPEDKRDEALKTFTEGVLKTILNALDKVLEKNEDLHLIKGKLTWSDLFLMDVVENLKLRGVDVSFATNVVKMIDNISQNNERVKSYMESDRNLRKPKSE